MMYALLAWWSIQKPHCRLKFFSSSWLGLSVETTSGVDDGGKDFYLKLDLLSYIVLAVANWNIEAVCS